MHLSQIQQNNDFILKKYVTHSVIEQIQAFWPNMGYLDFIQYLNTYDKQIKQQLS